MLYSGDFLDTLDGYSSSEVFATHVEGKSFSDPLRMVQYLDFKTYLPGDILTKVDRASMAHSLEVRVPFLDHTFVEWTAALPTRSKLLRTTGKHVLKEALRPLLPEDVLFRKKMGFAVPLDVWFRGSLKQHIADTVTGERLSSSGIFDADYLRRIVSEHTSGRRDHSPVMWALLMFDGFLQTQAG